MRLVTLGVGAQSSPRYAPAGLLVSCAGARVMIDGGKGAEPEGRLDAWLVTDEHAELRAELNRIAKARGLPGPTVRRFEHNGLVIQPRPVIHTNHPAYGYEIVESGLRAIWAPEFFAFPSWARSADLMFAEAAAWSRPIHFVGGVGGHMSALAVSEAAKRAGVKRLIFAHIGRPTIRAMDQEHEPSFGDFATDGQIFLLR